VLDPSTFTVVAAEAVDTKSNAEEIEQLAAINTPYKATLPAFDQRVMFHLKPMLSGNQGISAWRSTYRPNMKIWLRTREMLTVKCEDL
jgi:hypothetical protein